MPDSYTRIAKPNDTTTITVIVHSKGKFMGVLGLTYTGTASTITSTTGFTKIGKPTDSTYTNILKPTS